MHLWLSLVLALAPERPGTVELDGPRWRALAADAGETVAPAAWAEHRALELRAVPGGLQIRGRWRFRSLRPEWFSGPLFAAAPGLRIVDATWNGRPAALAVDARGASVAGRVDGRAELVVDAFVPADPSRAPLALEWLPAVRGRVEVAPPEGLVARLRIGGAPALPVGASHVGGAAAIELAFETARAPDPGRAAVVVASTGIGLTVGDAELRGRARLVWEVRQGALAEVAFTATGVGPDLEVKGAGVRRVAREGERVRVELQAPVQGRLELDLRWTTPVSRAAESRVPLPQISPEGVFRGETALQLARDGEVEAVPEAKSWTPVAAAALPGWAQGLVEGTPTAALRGGPGGSLDLLRFVPLEGPKVVVDVAAYTVATSREGRVLVRAHYEVRNERAGHLRVRPPAGFRVLGVRVAGKTAAPARARDGSWVVPLVRSVETLSGLLSFPVEVALLGETPAWRRRERRTLPLPVVDAPVAVSRLTLHLPPGYRSRLRAGEGEVVRVFDRGEGITYGLGVGEVGAAQADAVFQDAVQAWLENDFSGAQAKLDELRGIGARNENIDRLQGNLDVVRGKVSVSQDMSAQRRIREQAKARAYAEVKEQDELRRKASSSAAAGDYEGAYHSYQQAIAVGDKLAQLEQTEAVDQKQTNAALAEELKAVERQRAVKAPPARGKPVKAPPSGGETSTSRDFTSVVDDMSKTAGSTSPAATESEPAAGAVKDEGAPVQPASAPASAPASEERRYVVVTALSRPSFGSLAGPVRKRRRAKAKADADSLPAPVVHASALSVVVPAVGEAVRYQRLLLPAGAAYTAEISAREPLIPQD